MKFDVIIGNPPYQEAISDATANRSLAKQLFPHFIEFAISLKPKYCSLITPTRWFTADAQDQSFPKLREFIKKNNGIKKMTIKKASDVFPMIAIPGNVGYFLYEDGYSGDVEFVEKDGSVSTRPLFEKDLEIIIDSNINARILKKVRTKVGEGKYLTEITTGRNAFGFSGKQNFLEANSKGASFANCAKLKTRDGTRYIKKSSITKNKEVFENYKVFTSKSDGAAGLLSDNNQGNMTAVRIIGKAYIGEPCEACTDTYIPIGNFDKKIEAENLSKYMQTKFLRFMVGIMKTSQNITQLVYKFVPLQDFTLKSDIDWRQSIPEIDKQLYKKYGICKEDIEYIEKSLAPV